MKFIRNHPDAKAPKKAHDTDACFDLSTIDGATIQPGKAVAFDTGIKLDIPPGQCVLVFSRSGMGFKHDLRLSNAVGVIDSGYQDTVKVRVRNDGTAPYTVAAGDRIAQMMVLPVMSVSMEEAADFEEISERSTGGFGSTGA